jgi:CarD family transcriptional regulator
MVREIAAVDDVTDTEALKKIEAQLARSPRRAPKGSEEAEAEDAADEAEAA